MHTFLLCVATVVVGIEVGWQRLPEGGMQYIIQLEAADAGRAKGRRDDRERHSARRGRNPFLSSHRGEKGYPRETPPMPAAAAKLPQPSAADRQPPSPAPPHALARSGQPVAAGASGRLRGTAEDCRGRQAAAEGSGPGFLGEAGSAMAALDLHALRIVRFLRRERVSLLDCLGCPTAVAGDTWGKTDAR